MKKNFVKTFALCFLVVFSAFMLAGCGSQEDRKVTVSTDTWAYSIDAKFLETSTNPTFSFKLDYDLKVDNEVVYEANKDYSGITLAELSKYGQVSHTMMYVGTATASGETRSMFVTVFGETFEIKYTVS